MSTFARLLGVLAFVLLATQCFGAPPVATVSSTQSIVISGIAVPTNRVMSWPVSATDEIATQTAPATVRFSDGTVVTLQRNSRMRLEQGPAGIEVKMLSGSAMYDIKPHSTVTAGKAVAATRIPSQISLNSPARASAPASNEAVATALAYRMPAVAPSSGVVFAPMAISSARFTDGQFVPAATRQDYTVPTGGPSIYLPSGVILEVTPVPNSPGQYTITRILVPVTNASGQSTFAAVINSPLLGAGLSVANQGTGAQQITIFNGATPLTPDQANAALQQAAQNAASNAPGATVKTPGPITVDPVSPGR